MYIRVYTDTISSERQNKADSDIKVSHDLKGPGGLHLVVRHGQSALDQVIQHDCVNVISATTDTQQRSNMKLACEERVWRQRGSCALTC